MADFKLNPSALRKIGEQAKRSTVTALKTVQDDVFRTHAGQPVDKVRVALKARMARQGLTPSDKVIDGMADAISNRQRIAIK